MAGDWIKMRVGLTTNPRVLRIAECLLEDSRFLEWSGLSYGERRYPPSEPSRAERHSALRVTRYVTVTALLRFWGYANEHAKGERIEGVYPEDVDEVVGIPGFADAIEAAGWVDFDASGGLSMPNFGEHNTSAGERSGAAERQKRYRERKREGDTQSADGDVTRDVTRDAQRREEKRREEKQEQSAPRARGRKGKSGEVTLAAWTDALDGDAVPADDPIFEWATKAGLPRDWIALAWWAFEGRYLDADKTYTDWRAVFRKALREDWLKLWRKDRNGDWTLTTAGEQAAAEMRA